MLAIQPPLTCRKKSSCGPNRGVEAFMADAAAERTLALGSSASTRGTMPTTITEDDCEADVNPNRFHDEFLRSQEVMEAASRGLSVSNPTTVTDSVRPVSRDRRRISVHSQ